MYGFGSIARQLKRRLTVQYLHVMGYEHSRINPGGPNTAVFSILFQAWREIRLFQVAVAPNRKEVL